MCTGVAMADAANGANAAAVAPEPGARSVSVKHLGRRVGAALMTTAVAQPLEFVVVIGLLALVGFAAYGDHVRNAGFVTDDWAVRTTWLARTQGGDFWNFVDAFLHTRPALGIYLGVVQAVLGFHQHLYLGLALATAILLSGSFYFLLRTLRFPPLHAGVISVLTLVFPAADSLRLWAILSDGSWALALLVLGAVLTLRSFETNGRWAWALRAGGLALYALSLLTYEIGIVAIGTSVLLYRCAAPWRKAALAWAQDLVVAALVYVLALRHGSVSTGPPLSPTATIDHARTIAAHAFALVGTQVLPLGIGEGPVLALAGIVIATAALVARRLRADDPARTEIRRWLISIGVASAMTIAAYAVYAPGTTYYDPLSPGLGNRINALAALPLSTITYALGALVFLLVMRLPSLRARRWAAVGTALLGLALAASYFSTTRDHADAWTAGYRQATRVLNVMSEHMPKPPPGSMVLAFGQPIWVSPGIPVWAAQWDLAGAVQSSYHDLTLSALPAFPGTAVLCGEGWVTPVDPSFPVYLPTDSRPYGKLYLFSSDGHWAAPRNRKECRRLAPAFTPGPWFG
jgi:hypothetical protein